MQREERGKNYYKREKSCKFMMKDEKDSYV